MFTSVSGKKLALVCSGFRRGDFIGVAILVKQIYNKAALGIQKKIDGMKNGKEIIDKIFSIRNFLEKSGNEDIFRQFGLSVSTYVPLKMIYCGLETIAQMKQICTETVASLGQKIQKLENLHLVARELNKNDKRKWTFSVTGKGEEVLHEVELSYQKVSEDLFSDFSKQEKAALWELLQKIENNLKRR